MPASNDDIMKSVLTLEREFIHLQSDIEKDFKIVKDSIACHDAAIRDLQDLSLTREMEMAKIADSAVEKYNKSKTAKIQAFAPYFASLVTLLVAVLYIINQTPKP